MSEVSAAGPTSDRHISLTPTVTAKEIVSHACAYCQRRKMKCDGQSPCFNCSKRSLQCFYVSRLPRKKTGTAALKQRSIGDREIRKAIEREITPAVADYQGEIAALRAALAKVQGEMVSHMHAPRIAEVAFSTSTEAFLVNPTALDQVYDEFVECFLPYAFWARVTLKFRQ